MYGALMSQDRRLMLQLLGKAGATAMAISMRRDDFGFGIFCLEVLLTIDSNTLGDPKGVGG